MNGDGFYAEPNLGLISRVESYLQERSDVAHTVRVVSGGSSVVGATIDIELAILEAAVFSEVASDIDTELRSILKGRRFGTSLYLSTVYETIEAIQGIDTFDVQLSSASLFGSSLPAWIGLDSRGNIIVNEEYVISLGNIEITEKPV